MKNEKLINELVHKIRLTEDRQAKCELLRECLSFGCRVARRIIRAELYTDMIQPTDNEIQSLVYQAFERSIRWAKIDNETRKHSFKRFYCSMIKFQVYRELKTTLNYKVISKTDIKVYKEEHRKANAEANELTHLRKAQVSYLIHEVIEFLGRKNEKYAQIVLLKSQGICNKDICKKLEISELALKSRIQYIKKLIREEFDVRGSHF